MASQVARWVSRVRAWMQSVMAVSWLVGVLVVKVSLFRDRQKIASDAMEVRSGHRTLSLAACGVSRQDPWDERGWVSK